MGCDKANTSDIVLQGVGIAPFMCKIGCAKDHKCSKNILKMLPTCTQMYIYIYISTNIYIYNVYIYIHSPTIHLLNIYIYMVSIHIYIYIYVMNISLLIALRCIHTVLRTKCWHCTFHVARRVPRTSDVRDTDNGQHKIARSIKQSRD